MAILIVTHWNKTNFYLIPSNEPTTIPIEKEFVPSLPSVAVNGHFKLETMHSDFQITREGLEQLRAETQHTCEIVPWPQVRNTYCSS